MAPNRAGRIFVPTNPDLADILGRTDLNFENFYFFDFLDPRFPDAAASAAADGRTLRSQPDPSPNTPRDQIRRKGPCCDFIPGCVGRGLDLALRVCPLPASGFFFVNRIVCGIWKNGTRSYL